MRFVRFKQGGSVRTGTFGDNRIREIAGDMFGAYDILDTEFTLEEVTLLAPCTPTKVIAVGLNYRSHAAELNMPVPDNPLIFLKPPTAVIAHGAPILYPAMSQRVDYEAELGVVIGKPCRHVSTATARQYVFGYTCFNDVTARDLQQKDIQFTRSKSFDTFAPTGPWIETDLDPGDVIVESFLNGHKRQSCSTADLIFPADHLVSFISSIMTLNPGDVIATGTPSGIGPMQVGDLVEVCVEGVGTLRNSVAACARESGDNQA